MQTWDNLSAECETCSKCALCETRTNVVFGVGDKNAELMLVGEGPGAEEDRLGEPFVGRAGRLLDDFLKMIYLDRSMVYIANIVKCRPPGNRDPLPAERDACFPYLNAQIELVSPRLIVCLGRIAAKVLIDPDFKISSDHGKWYDIGGIRHMALFHPAALLRDPRRRPETFVDLKEIQRALRELTNN